VKALTRRWLENTQGLVEVEEGEKLAALARRSRRTTRSSKSGFTIRFVESADSDLHRR
jgi:hypothetical protein